MPQLKFELHRVYDTAKNTQSEIHYTYNEFVYDRRQVNKYIWKYENGKAIEMLQYQPPNRLYRKDLSFYDKNDRLVHSKNYFKSKLTCENYWKYDTKGRETEMTEIHHDLGEKTIYRYKYDQNDNLIEMKACEDNGDLEYRKVYTYNSKGQMIKEKHLYQDSIAGYETYEYDEQGNLRMTKKYRSALEEIETREYKYNKNGHKVFVTSIRYKCDCTGVREIPYEYEIYEYKYF
jgi:YD repeat-containing protein